VTDAANSLRVIRKQGLSDYLITHAAMSHFTDTRTAATPDEIWLLEHPAVFTLGRAGKEEHLLDTGNIPIIKTDRGGQVTYHGPGQLVVYLLIDLKRRKLGVRHLVNMMEKSIIKLLHDYDISAAARTDAPGVYVDDKKIAALGLRVRRGSSYHGLSLNIDMDLKPFLSINPCGYPGLEVTQISDLNTNNMEFERIAEQLLAYLTEMLEYATITSFDEPVLDKPLK